MTKILALALLLPAALGAALGAPVGGVEAAARQRRLAAFGSCGELVAYAKQNGARTVGPWGFGGIASVVGAPVGATPTRVAAPATAGEDFSGTNVQEEGVDEPDLVKTDGKRIVAIAGGRLRYVDVSGARPRLRDSLALGQAFDNQLLVRGDRALVISSSGGIEPMLVRIGPHSAAKTVLTEVDLSNPGALRVVRTLTVDGGFLAARLTGSTARLVVRTYPALPIAPPTGTDDHAAAEQRNESAIRRAKLQSWIPRYEVKAKGGTTRRYLTQCRSVRHPARFSGLGLVTVLTLDLDRSIEPVDSDAVMTNGEIVYASTNRLYVATQQWIDPDVVSGKREPPKVETALHGFDVSKPGRTDYRASGSVGGYLLSQWSLSEHKGFLRVASTTAPQWWPGVERPAVESESGVTVLDEREGRLVPVGHVGGLGRGERVFAVRFVEDAGYVVTFRQVDPLYTLDLASPAHPVVRGELKIQGYSAYLHPVGENLLLGVGQDATGEGRVLGTQVSLFDVSDLRAPKRLDHLTLAGASSEAEFDHHAFLYWPATRLAVLPLQTQSVVRGRESPFVGAVGVRVSRAGGVVSAGKVAHDRDAAIRRTLVVGDSLYTLSDAGLKESALATLADRAWLPFA
jgi:uncharacterized secreted protein with C-terminal beta-propeller domain